jgi:hypothetical protein
VNHYYSAYALTIQSQLLFPELTPLNERKEPDVFIRWGEVDPNGLSHPNKKGLSFQVNANELWLSVANVARFLVRNGREIIIDLVKGCDEDSVRVFLSGSCFGALLMQRDLLVLHGNVIQVNDSAVVFAGISGAGKSTLASQFYQRGYGILADDLCVINSQGQCLPGFPQLNLWADAVKHLDVAKGTLRKIRPCIEKYALPLGEKFYTSPLPLKGIYILNMHNREDIQFNPLAGYSRMVPLKAQAWRPQYLKGMYQEKTLQIRYAKLAQDIWVTRVTRPNGRYTIQELAQLVEEDWTKHSVFNE